MFNIGDFFGKIQGAYARDVSIRTFAQQRLKDILKIEAPIEKIRYENNILYVEGVSQAAKSTLFMKKQGILDALSSDERFARIKDVR